LGIFFSWLDTFFATNNQPFCYDKYINLKMFMEDDIFLTIFHVKKFHVLQMVKYLND